MSTHTDTLMVAVAVEDGDTMPKGHFGQAPRFKIFAIDGDNAIHRSTLDNPRAGSEHGLHEHGEHHHGHGDGHGDAAGHGAGIGRLLGNQGAQVMVSRAFGANIKHMRQRFLPIVVHCQRVDEAIALLQKHWDQVEQYWRQGEGRKHLVLR